MSPKVQKELQRFNCKASKDSWRIYQSFLATLLSSVQHPRLEKLRSSFEKKDWVSLVNDADDLANATHSSPAEHRLLNQVAAVIRKYPFPEDLVNFGPKERAMDIFLKSEHKCKRINQRFRAYRRRSPYETELAIARSYISYVLGDLNLADIWEGCNFGAGASIGIHGNVTNAARKLLSQRWSVTPSAFYYSRAALKTDIHIFELLVKPADKEVFCVDPRLFNEVFDRKAQSVSYNKIAFVPKTVKVHRAIAVEPLLNGYLQKGVDSYMRKRLKRVGIDLSDQSQNQELARQGSLGHLEVDAWSTIDLSSASDSISIELCRTLLPPEWFEFLNSLRSPCYRLDKDVKVYNKFVSMGNGFCFPLESLIFASLCAVACKMSGQKPDFRVYGDDILIRRPAFDHLLKILQVCGFTVNPKKTFSQGPFRESCGADWFEGEDVRPIILDYRFDSFESIVKFCNIARTKDSWKTIFHECLIHLVTLIPHQILFCRPFRGNADSALEVPFDMFTSSPFSRFDRKTQSWSWVEVVHIAVEDKLPRRFNGFSSVMMRGALSGVLSSAPFSERYNTRTKLRRVTTGSAQATILPTPYNLRYWLERRLFRFQ